MPNQRTNRNEMKRERPKNRQTDRRTGCSKVLSCDWQSMPVEISRVHTDKQTNKQTHQAKLVHMRRKANGETCSVFGDGGWLMESAMFAWIQTIIYKLTDILSYATIYYRYKLYVGVCFAFICFASFFHSVHHSPFYSNDTHFLFLASLVLLLLVLKSQFSYCLTHIRRRTLDWTPTNAISMVRF